VLNRARLVVPDNGATRKVNYHKENERCALGRTRTSDTRFRKPVLYPLSYEGVSLQTPWSGGLFPTPFPVYNAAGFGLGPHLGRTVTSIHAVGQGLKVVIEQM
jgi:hypothetical protein